MTSDASYVPTSQDHIRALKKYIKSELNIGKFFENEEISPNIHWRPSLYIKGSNHSIIAYEINEKVFPPVLALNRGAILNTNQPICVYSVCSEDEYIKSQTEFRKLAEEGFGLLTVDDAGNVTRRNVAIPLAQFIPKSKFKELSKGLSLGVRQRACAAFDLYNQAPVSGLEDITKMVEGITFQVASKIVAKGAIPNFQYKTNISLSDLLAEMATIASTKKSPLQGQRAAIGGFQSYVKEFRNPSHHEPKNTKEAAKLLALCQDGFTEGLRKISEFVGAFKQYGITVKL